MQDNAFPSIDKTNGKAFIYGFTRLAQLRN